MKRWGCTSLSNNVVAKQLQKQYDILICMKSVERHRCIPGVVNSTRQIKTICQAQNCLISPRKTLDFPTTLYLSNTTLKMGKNTISQSSSVEVISELFSYRV